MTGVVMTCDGRRYELPVLLEWKLQYGGGAPCDSFEVLCPWGTEIDGALAGAVCFEAAEDGKRVFRGVVDEYECRWTDGGGRLFLAGRGMAALLLDNEAEPADYQTATLEDILRDHVSPYGIRVAGGGNIPPVPWFSVESGSSEWQVLRNFTRYHGGVEPRFDREGRLVLAPWADEKRLVLGDDAPVTGITYRERRYGVLSEVLVIDRARRSSRRVVNRALADKGYRSRRVVCTPGRSSYQEMRYSGEFQLKESARERLCVEVTLAGTFLAWPGELVELKRSKPAVRGLWRVLEAESGVGESGAYCRLVLGEK